jgi:hypothetical protein
LPHSDELAHAILHSSDVRQLEQAAIAAGMIDQWARACAAVEAGITAPGEVRRILGVTSLPKQTADRLTKMNRT